MIDLDKIGGVPVVMRELLDAGSLNGEALTCTGLTMAENLAAIDPPGPDGVVVRAIDVPIHAEGGIVILQGSLGSRRGQVVKIAGSDLEWVRRARPSFRRARPRRWT